MVKKTNAPANAEIKNFKYYQIDSDNLKGGNINYNEKKYIDLNEDNASNYPTLRQ